MSKTFRRRAESGQAIIMVTMLMIGLIGFGALAWDGGHYLERHRAAQNAIDSATNAASIADCQGKDPVAAAKQVLKDNGFDPADPSVTFTLVTLPYDQTVVPNGTLSYTDFQGTLSIVMKTYFLPVLRIETLSTTTAAIARCIDKRLALEKATLAALSTTCQYTMNLSGSGINIEGSVFSNSDLKADSSTGGGTIAEGFYVTNLQSNGVTWTNSPQQISHPIADPGLFKASDYAPGSSIAVAAGSNYHYIASGDLTVNFNTGADLSDGIYYIPNGNLRTVGNMTRSHAITIVASGTIWLSATNIILSPYVNNLLFFSMQATNCGTGAISLSSKQTTWNGIIYAPNGGFSFSDSGNSSTNGGVMAQTIDIHSSNTQIMRNPGVSMVLPPSTYFVQ